MKHHSFDNLAVVSVANGNMDEEPDESSFDLTYAKKILEEMKDLMDENEKKILEKMKAMQDLDMENLKEAIILN